MPVFWSSALSPRLPAFYVSCPLFGKTETSGLSDHAGASGAGNHIKHAFFACLNPFASWYFFFLLHAGAENWSCACPCMSACVKFVCWYLLFGSLALDRYSFVSFFVRCFWHDCRSRLLLYKKDTSHNAPAVHLQERLHYEKNLTWKLLFLGELRGPPDPPRDLVQWQFFSGLAWPRSCAAPQV